MTREEAIKIIDCYDIGFYDLSGEKIPAYKLADAFDMAIEALQDRPTVDAVEVVRCKECKHFDEGHKVCKRAFNIAYQLKPTDYCSYGERRSDE